MRRTTLHPEVAGPRNANRLVHGYDAVDLDVLWATVDKDLPELERVLETDP